MDAQAGGMDQLVFQPFHLAVVFYQNDGATGAIRGSLGIQTGPKQADVAFALGQRHGVVIDPFTLSCQHVPKQRVPGCRQGCPVCPDHLFSCNAGELAEGVVPHQDLVIVAEGAQTNRKSGQHVAVMTTQLVQLTGHAGKARTVGLQPVFDEVDILPGGGPSWR